MWKPPRLTVTLAPPPGQIGAPVVISEDGGVEPFWSLDGSRLYYFRRSLDRMYSTLVEVELEWAPQPRVVGRTDLFEVEYSFLRSGMAVDENGVFYSNRGDPDEFVPSRVIMIENFGEELTRLVGPGGGR